MAKKAKKEETIFESFGHIAIVRAATRDEQSVLQIIITVDAKHAYEAKGKKKKGKK